MPLQVKCPNPACGKSASISDDLQGRTLRCRHCGQKFTSGVSTAPMADTASIGSPPDHVRDTVSDQPPSAIPAKKRAPTSGSIAANPGQGAPKPTPDGQTDAADAPQKIGRYEIIEELGAGAFGTVHRAFDPQLDREVALKVPREATLDSPKAVERFLREAKAAAQLRHPHIVPIYDTGRAGQTYYIASAFIAGQTLAEAIDEAPLDFRRTAQIVRDLAEALAYAHGQGIIHRDVKPANIMVDEKGQAHVMDFGLAHRHDSLEKLTHDGTILGTPAYMAPEQAIGKSGDPNPASDQYSLGVVLYEMLCGDTPFSGSP